jgi:hypothetical protein
MATSRKRLLAILSSAAVLVGMVVAVPVTAQASTPSRTCKGTFTAPGTLSGTYWGNVVVKGACEANAGRVVVHGNLTVAPGSALVAAFGLNDRTGKGNSTVRINGNVIVQRGAAMVLGCLPAHFACVDDPNPNAPTLSSADRVVGGIYGNSALGIVVHNTTIGGNVTQLGGGGGFNCNPHGVFSLFQSPVYSTYEDSSIGGNLNIADVTSCWMGTARVTVWGSAYYTSNKLADPDAIEILSNNIHGDLSCFRNSMVWDSGDLTNNLFPRLPQPNIVDGRRGGQCVLNSPTSPTDKPGPGKF